jgi:hypothetical protein
MVMTPRGGIKEIAAMQYECKYRVIPNDLHSFLLRCSKKCVV